MTGWTLTQFLSIFEHRTNVWSTPTRLWMDVGRREARRIAMQAGADDLILILGSRAAAAFDLEDDEPLVWIGRYALIPHPSGRCRFWNKPEAKVRARVFFTDLLERRAGASAAH